MSTKKDYIKQTQKTMDKYNDKISKIDTFLKNYKGENRSELLTHRKDLTDKLGQAEKVFKDVQSSSEDSYEKIKESATEIFENVKEAFHEFSSFLTMEQLTQAKDEIIDLSNEKLEDVQGFIKERPITAAAWAMGIGFVIGILLTRTK